MGRVVGMAPDRQDYVDCCCEDSGKQISETLTVRQRPEFYAFVQHNNADIGSDPVRKACASLDGFQKVVTEVL